MNVRMETQLSKSMIQIAHRRHTGLSSYILSIRKYLFYAGRPFLRPGEIYSSNERGWPRLGRDSNPNANETTIKIERFSAGIVGEIFARAIFTRNANSLDIHGYIRSIVTLF